MALPEKLRINAWTGQADTDPDNLDPAAIRWTARKIEQTPKAMRPAPPADRKKWEHADVGWGLILPENPDLSNAEQATAIDAPQPIQDLVAARQIDGHPAPVLRYSDALPKWAIRRYYADGSVQDPSLVASERGVKRGAVPRYLLIYAPPAETPEMPRGIPWDLQYRLNAVSYVGRLDLTGDALANYVSALLSDWKDSAAQANRAVVWATDHGSDDITNLMRRGIAKKIYSELHADQEIGDGAVYIDGKTSEASGQQLIDALANQQPALVVTTSHGMTGPLSNLQKMAEQIGVLVDGNYQTLDIEKLLQTWRPDGAIWYAHACCSAGSDSRTSYAGLVKPNSQVDQVLKGVAQSGARVAPLPRALLGAKQPLRAFVGHVEPTFDWTIRQPDTGQLLTSSLRTALYNRLFQQPPEGPYPLGYAFDPVHQHGPRLDMIHLQAKEACVMGEDRLDEALAARLTAVDRESLVILGDPTVALPPL